MPKGWYNLYTFHLYEHAKLTSIEFQAFHWTVTFRTLAPIGVGENS